MAFGSVGHLLARAPRNCPSPCDGPGMVEYGVLAITLFWLLPLSIGASILSVAILNHRDRR
jgi:hypothetical protein